MESYNIPFVSVYSIIELYSVMDIITKPSTLHSFDNSYFIQQKKKKFHDTLCVMKFLSARQKPILEKQLTLSHKKYPLQTICFISSNKLKCLSNHVVINLWYSSSAIKLSAKIYCYTTLHINESRCCIYFEKNYFFCTATNITCSIQL